MGGCEKMMFMNYSDFEYFGEIGERLDGRNLIDEWKDKYFNLEYVWNKIVFEKIDFEKVDCVMGRF